MPRTDRSRIRRYATLWSCAALMAGVALAGAAGTPSAVREVRVGVYENEPKILTDENGDASGILGELLTEVALRERWALQPVGCEWSRCLALLEAGEIDLLPDVAWSEQRDQVMDFHKVPSLYSWSALYRHPDIRLDSVLDLQGLRVAVLGGSIQQGYLQSMLESFNIDAEWVPVQSPRDGFARVADGDADAVVGSRHFGEFVVSDYGLRVTPVIFQPVKLYYATADGRNGELLAALDNYLQSWTRDPGSVYFRILERWGDRQPLIVLPSWARWGLASLSLMLMFTLAGVALLRWQVRKKPSAGVQRTEALGDPQQCRGGDLHQGFGSSLSLWQPSPQHAVRPSAGRDYRP
ncbi:transporter substrate-binding domain-containing protein [Marinobacterium aestuariivivens]|uniref:Transporter substrate-binding domain-containing protein n=1 Tax=Marinobacterium aestuariivivens TaxID=1698799 RepID=A0ABW2A735_9GAMM